MENDSEWWDDSDYDSYAEEEQDTANDMATSDDRPEETGDTDEIQGYTKDSLWKAYRESVSKQKSSNNGV